MEARTKVVRAKLIEARKTYKDVERERNLLIYEYFIKGWDVESLAKEFGMKEANITQAMRMVTNSKEN